MKLNSQLFDELISKAYASDRKRSHLNLHKTYDESVQRLCIALVKGTYVRPHHHTRENKWELLIALKGEFVVVVFDKNGVIVDKDVLTPGDSVSGIELPANSWHSVYPLSETAVIMEIKQGPYKPALESDFAQWAPREEEQGVRDFQNWLECSNIGDKYIDNGASK